MGSKIFCEQRMTSAQLLPFCSGQAAIFSVTSPDKTSVNEDSCVLIEHPGGASGVLVLADGAGGHAAGHRASAVAVESLVEFANQPHHENTRVAILDAIEHSNQTLLQQSQGSATTLLVVEMEGKRIRPYYIGDSTILVTGQRGVIKFQSIAQSPVGYAIESGIADEAEMRHSNDRHLVSNLLGTNDLHITVGPWLELAARDTLLLCSDGLTDNLFTDTIVETIRKGSLERVAAQLQTAAAEHMQTADGHPDDLSFILFRRR